MGEQQQAAHRIDAKGNKKNMLMENSSRLALYYGLPLICISSVCLFILQRCLQCRELNRCFHGCQIYWGVAPSLLVSPLGNLWRKDEEEEEAYDDDDEAEDLEERERE